MQEGLKSVPTELPARPPGWWEIATGILAIPATILGLAYSYVLIKKTQYEIPKVKAETEKLELEIREKRNELSPATVAEASDFLLAAVRPVIEFRRSQLLLLRFVVLYLLLTGWGLLEKAIYYMGLGLFLGLERLFHTDFQANNWLLYPGVALINAPKVGYWIVFIFVGWPLFREVNSLLGLNLRDWFRWRSPKE